MDLSIIIVSWNTKKLTLKCLKSIFQYTKDVNFEVFVVDNNSSDGTVEEVENLKKENKWNNLHIIANQENIGFARANNQAIKMAQGEFILLLNPDTVLDNSLERMINFMNTHSECGIVGPKLLNSDLTLQKSCRQFPGLPDQFFIQLKFYNFFPEKIKAVREYFMFDFSHNEIREVDQVMGAAMLVRREVFEKIGLLDEKIWAVFEEVDFCQRAKEAGFKIFFYPYCEIIHHKEQSFKQIASLKKQINFNRSLYHYFKKHKPFWQLFILWLVQPVNLLLTWVDSIVGIRRRVGKGKDL